MGSTREEQNNSFVTLRETGSKPSLSLKLSTRYFCNFDSCMGGRSFLHSFIFRTLVLYAQNFPSFYFNGKARSESCKIHL